MVRTVETHVLCADVHTALRFNTSLALAARARSAAAIRSFLSRDLTVSVVMLMEPHTLQIKFLAALPVEDFARLAPHLEDVSMALSCADNEFGTTQGYV